MDSFEAKPQAIEDGPNPKPPRILSRIYITPEGDLVITDLWDEVRGMLAPLYEELGQ